MNNDKTVYDILESVAATTSKNEKEAILMQHKDYDNLKQVFELAYSPTKRFYIQNIPLYTKSKDKCNFGDWGNAWYLLSLLSNREVTGNQALELVSERLSQFGYEIADVVCRIIKKDLRCGVGKQTINKVWKNLIVTPPRQGAASMNEKSLSKLHTVKNLAIELKSDGSYAASICGEESTMMSRNGNPLDIDCLQQHLSCGAFNGFALEGELIYDLDKATRSEGNGIITKVVKGTASDIEKDNTMYQVWDCIDTKYYEPKGEYPLSNKDRRELLESMMLDYEYWCREVVKVEPKIYLIPRKESVSVEEAFETFEQYVRDGYEGAIAKDMDATWKDVAKPTYCIKLKRKEPADLKVVSWYYAEEGSKYEGMLGGFNCESECGEIKVSVGSGFNEEEREAFVKEQPPIIEVEYDSITEDKKTGQKSLFLPIYKRPRYDKVDADSYKDILDKQKIK